MPLSFKNEIVHNVDREVSLTKPQLEQMLELTPKVNWNSLFQPKWIVLCVLVFQNSSHTLLTSYSKRILQEQYNPAVVILLSELTKLAVSLYFYLKESSLMSIQELIASSALMSLPALIYFINNWLVFIALKTLPPPVFSTLAQLKLLTTAIFSVIMLQKRISPSQWRALGLLSIGCVLVQVDTCMLIVVEKPGIGVLWSLAGTFTMILYACLSGFAGVYFEKVLKAKTHGLSLWARNIQLGFYSILAACVSLAYSRQEFSDAGIFNGFSIYTFGIVLASSSGGLLVALVVKYGDNIIKGFATAFAIILTYFVSVLYFGERLTVDSMIGTWNVVFSVFLYSSGSTNMIIENDHRSTIHEDEDKIPIIKNWDAESPGSANLFRRPAIA